MNQRRYGALLAYAAIIINAVIAFLFTPFLVSKLGQAGYGLFSIAGSFATYLTVMDLGLNDSIIRYLVGYQARGEHERKDHFFGVSLGIYLRIALLVLIFGAALYAVIPGLFSSTMDVGQVDTLRILTVIVTLNIALTIGLNPVTALITAEESFVFLRLSEIVAHVLTTLVAVVILLQGYGVVAVVAGMAATNMIFLLVKVLYAIKVLGMPLKVHSLQWHFVRDILGYSSPIIVVVLVEQIYWKLDNVILGAMIGAEVVAVFAIGLLFQKYFMSFGTAISRVMLPQTIREIEKGADGERITSLLVRVSRLQAVSLWLILSGLILFGAQFIVLWIGPEYEPAYLVMLCTLIPFSFELIGNLRNSVLQVKGLYWYRAVMILALALFNILLTIYLVSLIGMLGAAISTGIGIVLGFIGVTCLLHMRVGVRTGRYWQELATGLLPALIVSMLIGLYIRELMQPGWTGLALAVLGYTLAYISIFWLLGLNRQEKSLFMGFIRRRWVV